MLIHELVETAQDELELQQLARSIAYRVREGQTGTVAQLTGHQDHRLGDIEIQLQPRDRGAAGYRAGRITIDTGYAQSSSIAQIASAVVHELRHALDDKLSQGRSRGTKGEQRQYLHRPREINARLSQAMTAIRQRIQADRDEFSGPVDAEELYSTVDQEFRRNRISQLFPQGTASPRYRQLVRRAVAVAVA